MSVLINNQRAHEVFHCFSFLAPALTEASEEKDVGVLETEGDKDKAHLTG